MNAKQIFVVWLVLVFLSAIVAIVSNTLESFNFVLEIIFLLSAVKFLLVSFYFMELQKAHLFWKASLVGFLLLFFVITILIF